MKTESIKIIQKCQLSDINFSKNWFENLLKHMDEKTFDMFCREIILLNQHYITTVGLTATDMPNKIIEIIPDVSWILEEIDFNQPINFKQIF